MNGSVMAEAVECTGGPGAMQINQPAGRALRTYRRCEKAQKTQTISTTDGHGVKPRGGHAAIRG